ncbi:MAG: hypothetical protein JNL07_01775, partial [Rhodospirillales bacterium]|nr:hypothetical protein [Rhodospirillales bacterium]
PVRAWKDAVRAVIGSIPPARLAEAGTPPVALLWLGLGEAGGLLDAMARADDALGHGGLVLGAMGGGHVPDPLLDRLYALAARLPVAVAPRAGGGPLLRRTYEGPGSEMALRAGGLMYAGRLHPLKTRLLLDLLLRAGCDRAAMAAALDACE